MDFGLKGKTAVITGADSGMGFETARMLLEEGARVVVSDVSRADIVKAAAQLASHGEVHATDCDVTKLESVEAMRDFAMSKLGHVDILVNAAGVTGPTGDFHTIDDKAWHDALEIIVFGTVRIVRAFVTHMAERGSGRIILFGSEDAEQPYADELPYCAAKAALINLTKGLSKTYSKQGVLINIVSPAYIATPMTDAMMEKRAKENDVSFDEAVETFLKEERPTLELQRRGKPEEVASLVAFLCSKHATFITGSNYRVDGGSVATI